MEAGYAKNSKCFHRSPRLSNHFPKSQSKDRSKSPLAVGWITLNMMFSYSVKFKSNSFFVSESKNSQIGKPWTAYSDFGKKLEVLRLLLENLRFFSHPASMQGVKKKGVFSPDHRKEAFLRLITSFLTPIPFRLK